jgi:hypothetical protein
MVNNLYRFYGSLGAVDIESCSDLLALSQARNITERRDITLLRWTGKYYIPLSLGVMLYGPNAKQNLIGAFGSADAKTLKKAEKIYN